MTWVRSLAREVFGLFVDDGPFALAIVVWLGVVWLLLSAGVAPGWMAVCLFAGLASILVGSAVRQARLRQREEAGHPRKPLP